MMVLPKMSPLKEKSSKDFALNESLLYMLSIC